MNDWTDEQRALLAELTVGRTVVADRYRHPALIAYAAAAGLVTDTDEAPWTTPFAFPYDGDRAQIVASYRVYLQMRPSLQGQIPGLRGRCLVGMAPPDPHHAQVLAELAEASAAPVVATAQAASPHAEALAAASAKALGAAAGRSTTNGDRQTADASS